MNLPYGFKAALQQFTIIPITLSEYSAAQSARAIGYLPLVGAVLGLTLCSLAWLLGGWLTAWPLAILLTILQIILTGGLHEDGLADVADSFGARSIDRAVAILKDSRLGTFGVLALILLLMTRVGGIWGCLNAEQNLGVIAAVFSLARVTPLMIVADLPYFSSSSQTALINRAAGSLTAVPVVLSFILSALFLGDIGRFLLALLIILLSGRLLIWLFKRNFSGYNGDCLGSAICVTEMLLWVAIA